MKIVKSFNINKNDCLFIYLLGILCQSLVVIYCHYVVISWQLNDYQMTIE